MKAPSPIRYKVDVSKRLSGRTQGAWFEREDVMTLLLRAAKVITIGLVILYPWSKYQNAYIPLTESITGKQAEISRLSDDIGQANKQLEELIQRSRQMAEVRLQRKCWSDKLLNLAQWVPDNVYITEVSSQGKSFIMRGLTPILEKGEYLAKMVSLTQKINNDSAFTKNFQPIQLNYTRQTKVTQPNLPTVEMVEFELEAEAK